MLLSQMPETIDAVCVQLKTAIADAYRQGQHAERERIRDIIKAVGVQGNHNEWFDCVDTILERIDG